MESPFISLYSHSFDISNSFQIIFHLTPHHIEISFPIELLIIYIESNLTEDDISFINREIVPISTLYDLRNGGCLEVKYIIILLFSLLNVLLAKNHNQKGQSKFERRYRECSSTPICMNRPNDEDCIYKCISIECYNEMIVSAHVLLEFGENNNEFKKIFEHCYNYKSKTKRRTPF